ncbi:MAG TPA: DUF1735 domain-containing protein [Chitinophagaceae bacterium]
MKIYKITSAILAVVLATSLAGCLKDKDYDDGLIQSVHSNGPAAKVVEIKLTAGDVSNFLVVSYDNSPTDTVVDLIPVNLATHDAAPEDLHVTLVLDQSWVNDYNTANGTAYGDPSAFYTVEDGGVVTIPKGQHTGFLKLKFKPSSFLGADWAVGFKLSAIQEPGYALSGNLSNGIVAIAIKNKYDGNYNLTMKTVGWADFDIADGQTFTWPTPVSMVTSGVSSVTILTQETGNAQNAFDPDGNVLSFGATAPQYIFDPHTDKLVDVKNLAPDDGRGRAFALNPAVTDSRYDPATRTIYAAYLMMQIGRPNQEIYDTLTYIGPR